MAKQPSAMTQLATSVQNLAEMPSAMAITTAFSFLELGTASAPLWLNIRDAY